VGSLASPVGRDDIRVRTLRTPGVVAVGAPLRKPPGESVRVPILVHRVGEAHPATLQFAIATNAPAGAGGAPSFTPAPGIPRPDVQMVDGEVLLLGWLHPLPTPPRRTLRLGWVAIPVSSGFAVGEVDVRVHTASASSLAGDDIALEGSELRWRGGGSTRSPARLRCERGRTRLRQGGSIRCRLDGGTAPVTWVTDPSSVVTITPEGDRGAVVTAERHGRAEVVAIDPERGTIRRTAVRVRRLSAGRSR
jgi:hypothetical protein